MSNYKEYPQPLTEGQFIGKLILGTEGKPLEKSKFPENIMLAGRLFETIQKVWAATIVQDADYLKERAIMCTTHGDRKLHIDHEVHLGSEMKVVMRMPDVRNNVLPVLVIHSHGIIDTLPSTTDLVGVLFGSNGAQAEAITTATADFMLVRSAETLSIPNLDTSDAIFRFSSQREAIDKLGALFHDFVVAFETKYESEIIATLKSNRSPEDGSRRMIEFFDEKIKEGNAATAQFILELCEMLSIGFYYSEHKDGNFIKVDSASDLLPYTQALPHSMLGSVEKAVLAKNRTINPETFQLDESDITNEFIIIFSKALSALLENEGVLQELSDAANKNFAQVLAFEGIPTDKNGWESLILKQLLSHIQSTNIRELIVKTLQKAQFDKGDLQSFTTSSGTSTIELEDIVFIPMLNGIAELLSDVGLVETTEE